MLYFAFGSNMNLDRMKSRNTNFEFRTGAVLYGYKLTFNKKAGFGSYSTGALYPSKVYGLGRKTLTEDKTVTLSSAIHRRAEFQEAQEGYANIVPDENSYVEGALYVVPPSGIKELDRCEGVPTHYTREILEVVSVNGVKVKAVVYVAADAKEEDNLLPTDRYLSHLLKGRDLLSDEYFQKLAKQKTISEYSNNSYNNTGYNSHSYSGTYPHGKRVGGTHYDEYGYDSYEYDDDYYHSRGGSTNYQNKQKTKVDVKDLDNATRYQ